MLTWPRETRPACGQLKKPKMKTQRPSLENMTRPPRALNSWRPSRREESSGHAVAAYGEQYEGGKKAKARAIVLGYQDPRYSERNSRPDSISDRKAVVLSILCVDSFQNRKIEKGNISGAVLQGDLLDEELWRRPLEEITDHLGIAEGTPLLMRRAAYGLVQAPLHWHQSINKYLTQQGYRQLTLEPCCWVWVDSSGEVQSIVHVHVDDFLLGGKPNNTVHQQLISNIREAFKCRQWRNAGERPDQNAGEGSRLAVHATGLQVEDHTR